MKRGHSSLAFTLALVIGDAIAILLAYVVAYILRVSLDHTPVAKEVSAAGYFESLIVLLQGLEKAKIAMFKQLHQEI